MSDPTRASQGLRCPAGRTTTATNLEDRSYTHLSIPLPAITMRRMHLPILLQVAVVAALAAVPVAVAQGLQIGESSPGVEDPSATPHSRRLRGTDIDAMLPHTTVGETIVASEAGPLELATFRPEAQRFGLVAGARSLLSAVNPALRRCPRCGVSGRCLGDGDTVFACRRIGAAGDSSAKKKRSHGKKTSGGKKKSDGKKSKKKGGKKRRRGSKKKRGTKQG